MSDGRKNLKRPRGLLASRKKGDEEPGTKKRRSEAPRTDLDQETINAQDWNDLKELYENALGAFYGENPTSALPLVRGVLHECARLVSVHKDPTAVYSPREKEENSPYEEPASAFYTIYASAWYLMYHFAQTDASALTEDEPDEPVVYLLSALAACEDGREALESRKQERSWNLELIWGRTLIGTAQSQTGSGEDDLNETSRTKIAELAGPDVPSILRKGLDRLSYAIAHRQFEDPAKSKEETKIETEQFAQTLLVTAQDVLALAEYLDQEAGADDSGTSPFDNTYFKCAKEICSRVSAMADLPENVRAQGKLGEAQVLLSIGAAIAERLEGGDEAEQKELRERGMQSLKSAISKFESLGRLDEKLQTNREDVKPLYLEALVTLATLLPEGDEQEAMYARYRAEGGVLDGDDEEEENHDE